MSGVTQHITVGNALAIPFKSLGLLIDFCTELYQNQCLSDLDNDNIVKENPLRCVKNRYGDSNTHMYVYIMLCLLLEFMYFRFFLLFYFQIIELQ